MIPQRLWKKIHLDITYIMILAYFILFKFFKFYLLHPKIENIQLLVHHAFFTPPYLMDYVVTTYDQFVFFSSKHLCQIPDVKRYLEMSSRRLNYRFQPMDIQRNSGCNGKYSSVTFRAL